MLGRLKLTAMRDRLDVLLDEAARRELNLPEALGLLCEAEVAHREERRIQMGLSIAKFPYVRTLEGFDFAAQPSLDPKQVRELAACRWVANGDTLLVQGPPGVGKSHIGVRHGSMRQTAAVEVTATGGQIHGPEPELQARGGAGVRPER
jgi:DNA replication protein DnaC